jgi:hypothetical protein
MRKSSIISSLVLFVAAMMLSGCLFPPPGFDEGGGSREGGHHDGGHRDGGERR